MSGMAVVSIVTGDYLSRARALAHSIRAHNSDVTFHVCIADCSGADINPSSEPFHAFSAAELGIPDWPRFAFQYSALELCCALKPYALRHVWQTTDASCLVYLDSDMQVYGSLAPLLASAEGQSVVLTPHLLSPLGNPAAQEAEIRRRGVYNGGFVAVRRTSEAEAFLSWWIARLAHHCMVDVRAGIFADQSWLDLVPGCFREVLILRNAGCNVGYWNLKERPLTRDAAGRFLAGSTPLTCFHFSGFDPAEPQRLSRHCAAHETTESPVLDELRRAYATRLAQCGSQEAKPAVYGFSKLKDGTFIEPAWREAIRQGRLQDVRDPFDTRTTPELVAQLKWEGAEAWPHRLDWRYAELERVCDTETLWRRNYWHLATSFPVNALLWLRRRLQGTADPTPDLRQRTPPLASRYTFSGDTTRRSETSHCRARLARYCQGYGVDLGFGGDPILDSAVRVDMPTPYTSVGNFPVQLGGDAAHLDWFRDGVLDYVFSSHLLEDFEETETVLREWLRVLKPGGRLILYCPDEQRYREHCRRTGQSHNTNHKQPQFSLALVKDILMRLKQTHVVHENPSVDAYSWELVCEKLESAA